MSHTPAAAPPVLSDIAAGIATVTLNRPASMNALSDEMLLTLQSTLEAIAADNAVRAVVLRSAGPHFCAGHDLKEMTARRADSDGGRAAFEALFETCSRLMMTIAELPQPVIAEVTGIATAAGCQLVASCDLVVAAESARFATSGVNYGLFCSTPMVALSRTVPRKAAMEMLLLGDFIDAGEARRLGLVNRVVPEAEVSAAAQAMAAVIAAKSPVAIRIGKRAFHDQAGLGLAEAYACTGRAMAENMMTRDAERGIGAFVTKTSVPDWTGE